MQLCDSCEFAEYHGFRHDNYPTSIHFWCPVRRTHTNKQIDCRKYKEGTPTCYDKVGEVYEFPEGIDIKNLNFVF